MGSIAFNDAFPFGLSGDGNVNNGCGGRVSASVGSGGVSLSGGTVAARQTCTISVDVRTFAAGARPFTSGSLTSDLPVATPGATATLTVNQVPLSVSMAFEPPSIGVGHVSRLSYELRNGAAVRTSGVSLSDTLPADVVVADSPNVSTTCGAGLFATAGAGEVELFGGRVTARDDCTIAVDVTSALAGSYPNVTQSVTSSLGVSATAEATLTVDPADAPGFARVFAPDTIRQGGETEVVFTIDNGANAIGMTAMAFDDALPAGVSVAETPGPATVAAVRSARLQAPQRSASPPACLPRALPANSG